MELTRDITQWGRGGGEENLISIKCVLPSNSSSSVVTSTVKPRLTDTRLIRTPRY